MKVGILTQPLINNYGGILQNYALQQVLIRHGHDAQTIDWKPAKINPLKRKLRLWKNWILYKLGFSLLEPGYNPNEIEQSVISYYTDGFIKKYICLCPYQGNGCSKLKKIKDTCKYEAYIVGSDQVWRPSYNAMQTALFLDFCKDDKVKRIAYAASFGTSEWEFTNELGEKCGKLAHLFDLVTVREKSGIELCKDYLGVNALQVLDPTLLLEKSDYLKLVNAEKEQITDGSLYYYILDFNKEKKEFIDAIAQTYHLIPFTVMPRYSSGERTRDVVKNYIDECIFPPVTKWIKGFDDAKMVIVDSFHGAVFSIIFNKPFWIIENESRGNTRFDSLLDLFGLQSRLISDMSSNVEWDSPIDWDKVNSIIREERSRCLSLLFETLDNN